MLTSDFQKLYDDPDYYRGRPHMKEQPLVTKDVSGAWLYPKKDRAAIGLPIFGMSTDRPDAYFWAKSAVYTALRWVYGTDARANGVPVFFLVGELCADSIMDVLDRASIPKEYRVVVPQTERIWCTLKLLALLDSAFDAYERMFVSDVDFFPVLGDVTSGLYTEVLDVWDAQEKGMCGHFVWKAQSEPEESPHLRQHNGGSMEPFWETLRLAGETVGLPHVDGFRDRMENPEVECWGSHCCWVGISRTLYHDVRFREFIRLTAESTWSDQAALEAWLAMTGDIPQYFWPKTTSLVDLEHGCFTHGGSDAVDMERWLSEDQRLLDRV